MQTITTYNGIILGFVEIPFRPFNIGISTENVLVCDTNDSANWQEFKLQLDEKWELFEYGTTSTLTNEQVEPFIECKELIGSDIFGMGMSLYFNYTDNGDYEFDTALESFNSLLEVNKIDLSREYCILQIKND